MDKPPSISIPTSVAYKGGNGCNLEAVPCMLRNTDGTTGVVGLLIRPSTSSANTGGKAIAPAPIKQSLTTSATSSGKILLPSTHTTTQLAPLRPRVTVSTTSIPGCTPSTSSSGTTYFVATNNKRITSSHNIDERSIIDSLPDHCRAIKPAIYGASSLSDVLHITGAHPSPLEVATAHTLDSYQQRPSTSGQQVHYLVADNNLVDNASNHQVDGYDDALNRSIEPQLEWQQPTTSQLPADERPTSSSSCATTTEQVERKPKRRKRAKRRHRNSFSRSSFSDMPRLTPVEGKDHSMVPSTSSLVKSSSLSANAHLADKFATIFESVLSNSRTDCSAKASDNTRSTDDESTRAASRSSVTELAEKLILDKDPASLASSLMQNLDDKQLKQLAKILGSKFFGELKATTEDDQVAESTLQNSDSCSPTSTTTIVTATCNGGVASVSSPVPVPSPQVVINEPADMQSSDAESETQEEPEPEPEPEPETLSVEQRKIMARLHRYRLNALASQSQNLKTDIMRLIMRMTKIHLATTYDDIHNGFSKSKPSCFKTYSQLAQEKAEKSMEIAPTLSRCDQLNYSGGLEEEDLNSELDSPFKLLPIEPGEEEIPLATSTPVASPEPSCSQQEQQQLEQEKQHHQQQPLKLNLGDLKRRSSKVSLGNGGTCSVTDDHKLPPKKRRKPTKLPEVVVELEQPEVVESSLDISDDMHSSFSSGKSSVVDVKPSGRRVRSGVSHKLTSPNCKYVDRGRYCKTNSETLLSLPFNAASVREAAALCGRDYKLPYDIWWESECNQSHVNSSTDYKPIKSNVYIDMPPESSNTSMCSCTKECSDECLNRQLFIECTDSTCQLGPACTNRRLQKRQWCSGLQAYDTTTSRGWGVKTTEAVSRGSLLCEYVGEVVSGSRLQDRMNTIYNQYKHHYALMLHAGYVIDSYRQGSVARLFNHSCKPNCTLQKWNVNGQQRIGVYADDDISPGTELCYDYRFHTFNEVHNNSDSCLCNSSNCRGAIGLSNGGRKLSNSVTSKQRALIMDKHVFLLRTLQSEVAGSTSRRSRRRKPCRLKRKIRLSEVHEHMWQTFTYQSANALASKRIKFGVSPASFDRAVSNLLTDEPKMVQFAWTQIKQRFVILMSAVCASRNMTFDSAAWLNQPQEKSVQRSTHGDVLISSVIDESYLNGQQAFGLHDSDDPMDVWSSVAPESSDHVRCICGIQQEEGLMLQCDTCHYWLHHDCMAQPTGDEYTCHFCDHNTERCPSLSIRLKEQPTESLTGCSYFRTLAQPDNGLQIRLDECVYVVRHISGEDKAKLKAFHESYVAGAAAGGSNVTDKTTKPEPTSKSSVNRNQCLKLSRRDVRVFRVDRLFTAPDGQAFVFGFYYAYPHETFCEPTRRFYQKEVLCTPLYDTLPLSCVVGRCLVLNKSDYSLGRPKLPHYAEDDVYVCEYKVDKHQRLFTPIRSKNNSFTKYDTTRLFHFFPTPLKVNKSFTPFILLNLNEKHDDGSLSGDADKQIQRFKKLMAQKRLDKIFRVRTHTRNTKPAETGSNTSRKR